MTDSSIQERAHMQSLAKWVGLPESTASLDIACEVSTLLEQFAALRARSTPDREAVMAAIRSEMRSRTYDRHAYDEEVFEEGVGGIADAVFALLAGSTASATDENADYREVFGRDSEPWRAPLGALRLTLADETAPDWQLERARAECEELVRVLNDAGQEP